MVGALISVFLPIFVVVAWGWWLFYGEETYNDGRFDSQRTGDGYSAYNNYHIWPINLIYDLGYTSPERRTKRLKARSERNFARHQKRLDRKTSRK